MKKFLLFALLSTSFGQLRAQTIAAGTVALGGSIGYTHSTSKSSSGSSSNEASMRQFSFSPAASYFAADNLALGVNLSYTAQTPYHISTGSNSSSPDANTSLRVGPFVQYYKMLTEQFGFTGMLGAGYQNVDVKGDGNPGDRGYTSKGYYAAITPGVVFFPIPKFGISASIGSLGYDHLSYDYPNAPSGFESTTSTIGASFGLDKLLFGGTYYFGR